MFLIAFQAITPLSLESKLDFVKINDLDSYQHIDVKEIATAGNKISDSFLAKVLFYLNIDQRYFNYYYMEDKESYTYICGDDITKSRKVISKSGNITSRQNHILNKCFTEQYSIKNEVESVVSKVVNLNPIYEVFKISKRSLTLIDIELYKDYISLNEDVELAVIYNNSNNYSIITKERVFTTTDESKLLMTSTPTILKLVKFSTLESTGANLSETQKQEEIKKLRNILKMKETDESQIEYKQYKELDEKYNITRENNDDKKNECAICLLDIDDITELVIAHSANGVHKFHSNCIYQWVDSYNRNDCPLCRLPISNQDYDAFENNLEFQKSRRLINKSIHDKIDKLSQENNINDYIKKNIININDFDSTNTYSTLVSQITSLLSEKLYGMKLEPLFDIRRLTENLKHFKQYKYFHSIFMLFHEFKSNLIADIVDLTFSNLKGVKKSYEELLKEIEDYIKSNKSAQLYRLHNNFKNSFSNLFSRYDSNFGINTKRVVKENLMEMIKVIQFKIESIYSEYYMEVISKFIS